MWTAYKTLVHDHKEAEAKVAELTEENKSLKEAIDVDRSVESSSDPPFNLANPTLLRLLGANAASIKRLQWANLLVIVWH